MATKQKETTHVWSGADGSWQREPSASAKDLKYRRKLSVLEKGQFIAGNRVR